MAITEENRHQLYRRLEEVLGHDEATVIMEHLPPVGWADVATKRDLDVLAAMTKRDLDALAELTKRDLESLSARLDARLERSLREQTNRYFVGTGAMLTAILTIQQLVERLLG